MIRRSVFLCLLLLLVAGRSGTTQAPNSSVPFMGEQGNATELIVAEKPSLVPGGDLGNSGAWELQYMQPMWNKLQQLHYNAVLAPVYRELPEPEEWRFDFTLVDSLILQAREHNMKIEFLGFGPWTNNMSCYVHCSVKKGYPRACDSEGVRQEIPTPFSMNNLNAGVAGFVAPTEYIELLHSETSSLEIQIKNRHVRTPRHGMRSRNLLL